MAYILSYEIQKQVTDLCQGTDVHARSYSGRAMYGRKCFALTGSHQECFNIIGQLIKDMTDELFDIVCDSDANDLCDAFITRSTMNSAIDALMGNIRWDSMGHDIVIYWPDSEYLLPDSE